MSSNLKDKITWMVLGLNSASEVLAADVTKAVRRACEHTAHDVVVTQAARTQVLHEYGRLEEFKKEVATIAAEMKRFAEGILGNPGIWPHRGNGNFDAFESSVRSVPGASEPKLGVKEFERRYLLNSLRGSSRSEHYICSARDPR